MFRMFATGGALAMCLALFGGPSTAAAADVPQAVKDACSDDFQKHCKAHKPDSDAARGCMADVFSHLSDPCVSAILNSDLVDEQAATAKQETRLVETASPERNDNKVHKANRHKHGARSTRRRVARHGAQTAPKRIARYIKRGTRIANSYISKAFAKAFR